MSSLLFLIDTNVAIGYLDGRDPARELKQRHGVVPGSAAASQITRIELLGFPRITPQIEAHITAFLSTMAVIRIDDHIEAEAIALRRRTRLKLADAVIAARPSPVA